MRNVTIATLAMGMLLAIASDGLTQEAAAERTEKTPLQIIDDCVRAVRERDFGTYVNHLSRDEQKLQAGYALLMLSEMLPAVEMGSEQIEPEVLLFVRAVEDLVQQHTGKEWRQNGTTLTVQAITHLLQAQSIVPASNNAGLSYSTPQVARVTSVRDVLMKSGETLLDPRSFLIAVMTEIARPVEVAGAEPVNRSELPQLLEFVKVYEQQTWTLYTRGVYAIAVPATRESVSQSSPAGAQPTAPKVADAPQPTAPKSEKAPWPLRIEFQKIEGVWKISHVLPISVFSPITARTAGICTGPQCNADVSYFVEPAAVPLPGSSVQPYSPAPAALR